MRSVRMCVLMSEGSRQSTTTKVATVLIPPICMAAMQRTGGD